MFTGIIKGVGRVVQLDQQDETATLTLQADLFREIQPQLGDSIAINGTCLTATAVSTDQVTVEVMPETSRRTNLGRWQWGVGSIWSQRYRHQLG